MKVFRGLVMICAAVAITTGAAMAQEGGRGPDGPSQWRGARDGQFGGEMRGGPMAGRDGRHMRMRRRGMHRMHDPVARLLEHQTMLHLTPTQVNSIISIDDKLHGDNRPLMERLMAMRSGMRRGGFRGQRGAGGDSARTGPSSAQRDSAMTIMRTIRENTWRATAAANAVLSQDQLNTAGNLDRAGRPPMMFFRQGMTPPGGPRSGGGGGNPR